MKYSKDGHPCSSMVAKLVVLSFVSLAVANVGVAQERDNSDTRLEEIIVTATKRESTVQDIPLSVTALGEAQLEKVGAKSLEDYARFVPAVSFIHRAENNRAFQPNIRGIQLGRGSPTTAFYIDETPLHPLNFDRTGLPDPSTFDINRVEVLKGPQGTLYGSAALGGAIKVVPNSPNSQEYEARLQGEFSRYTDGGPGQEINGMVNIPIVEDKLALRVTGSIGETEGYIRGVEGSTFIDLGITGGIPVADVSPTSPVEALESASLGGYLNDTELFSVRAALEWQATDSLSVTPSVFIWTFDEGHGRQISGEAFNLSGDELLIFPIFDGVRAPTEQQNELYNLKSIYNADWGEIVGSLTFFNTEWNRNQPAAGLLERSGVPTSLLLTQAAESVNSQEGREEQTSIELRASADLGSAMNFTGGVFYRDVGRRYLQFQLAPESFVPFLGTNIFDNENLVDTLEELAVFGEATWAVTDTIEITGGMRWADYERTSFKSLTGFFAAPTLDGGVEEDLVTYSASVKWELNDNSTFYARAADGFRPGFVTSASLPSACDQDLLDIGIEPGSGTADVDADALTNYEMGWKARLFDDRLSINASAYHINWEDIQIDLRLPCAFTLTQNAGQAEVDGFELELNANPIDWLNLILTVGKADTQLTEDAPAVGGTKGEPLPQANEWTVSSAVEFYPSLLAEVNGYFRIDGTFTDDSLYNFRTDNARERDIKEGVFLTNVRFGFTAEDWDVTAYAKNVLNRLERGQCRDTSFQIIGERVTCANEPREIGIRMSKAYE